MKYKIKFYNILRDRQILIMFCYSQNENTVSLKKIPTQLLNLILIKIN